MLALARPYPADHGAGARFTSRGQHVVEGSDKRQKCLNSEPEALVLLGR